MKSLPFHTRRHSPADRPRTTRFGHVILERSSNPRLPACSRDCHCASRSCVEADLVAPVARNAEVDRGPTSRLHHEAAFAAAVSRNDAGDLTARGARTLASMFGPVSQTDHRGRRTVLPPTRPTFRPVSRTDRRPRRGFLRGGSRCTDSVSRAKQRHPAHRPPVLGEQHLVVPVARLDGARSPARVARARDAGNFSPGFPSVDHQPHCARSEHDDVVFTRFPGCSRRRRCTAAHALEAPTPRSCPRGVFPRHAVACVSSGVAVRSSFRPVARAIGCRQR
jgi:hypothetical protein